MNEKLVKLLIEKKYTISTAESITGGLISSKIIEVANASQVINTSFITYSDESKIDILGIDFNTIRTNGVVSEEVVREMAINVAKKVNSDVAVATSGYAGPTGNPIGKVCFGFYLRGKIFSITQNFVNEGRNVIREESAVYAISKLYELLVEEKYD